MRITIPQSRDLKKFTIRLPADLPARLSALTGLGYNEVIRNVLILVADQLERKRAASIAEAASLIEVDL